jgi:hypothetical protein
MFIPCSNCVKKNPAPHLSNSLETNKKHLSPSMYPMWKACSIFKILILRASFIIGVGQWNIHTSLAFWGGSCASQESPPCWSSFGFTPFGLSYWMTSDRPPFELWRLRIKENKQIRNWKKKKKRRRKDQEFYRKTSPSFSWRQEKNAGHSAMKATFQCII